MNVLLYKNIILKIFKVHFIFLNLIKYYFYNKNIYIKKIIMTNLKTYCVTNLANSNLES